jgi:hypothetical protein
MSKKKKKKSQDPKPKKQKQYSTPNNQIGIGARPGQRTTTPDPDAYDNIL